MSENRYITGRRGELPISIEKLALETKTADKLVGKRFASSSVALQQVEKSLVLIDGDARIGFIKDSIVIITGDAEIAYVDSSIVLLGGSASVSHADGSLFGKAETSIILSASTINVSFTTGTILGAPDGIVGTGVRINSPYLRGETSLSPNFTSEKLILREEVKTSAKAPFELSLVYKGESTQPIIYATTPKREVLVGREGEPLLDSSRKELAGFAGWKILFANNDVVLFGKGEERLQVKPSKKPFTPPKPPPLTFSDKAEVRVIGLYESKLLHQRATISVQKTTAPLILVLSSYGSIEWEVTAPKDAVIEAIIITGWSGGASIVSAPPGAPIKTSFGSYGEDYVLVPSTQDTQSTEYQDAIHGVVSLTGKEPMSMSQLQGLSATIP